MISALRHSPLRVLLVLATLLAAVAVATGSGATFSSTSATRSNPLVTGTLLQTNSKTGAAVLSASGLRPGGQATGTVTIGNTGTLPATITLAETNATNTFAAGSMTLRVVDDATSTVVYDGDVGRLGTKTLAPFPAGASRTLTFTATLSASAPTTDQGKSAQADYTWNAVPTPSS